MRKLFGQIEGSQGDSQELYVGGAQFLSHYDGGAPASVYIETHTAAVLFAGALTLPIEPERRGKSINVQRSVIIVLINNVSLKAKIEAVLLHWLATYLFC